MELRSISGQQNQTLYEFYDPKKWPAQWGKMPEMMCRLIETLESIDHASVWVFTSHAELLFTTKDDYKYWQVLVQVVDIDTRQYYKITAAQADPWHHLTAFADNHNTAAEIVISGLSIAAIGKSRNIFLDSN